jgi:squalene cyclase
VSNNIYDWLMEGDPSIRWQVMRDLLGADKKSYQMERRKIASEGWGYTLLSYQDATGRWGGQLYNNKWLSTTYTLLLLHQMGLEPSNKHAHLGCRELLEGGFKAQGGISYARTVDCIDNGVTGMVLEILAYFEYPDERLKLITEYLLDQQSVDGQWEPVPGNQNLRYVFDTTLLVLDGLHEYEKRYPHASSRLVEVQNKARKFLLNHDIYKSIQTGEDLDKKITLFSFPPRWHYDVLVALDYFQECKLVRDKRISGAIDLLESKRNPDGTWNLQNRHAGKTFFEMEQVGQPSRWNTLRALRVLKWWYSE